MKVSEVGSHTANVTYDWNITGVTADQIKNVCFVVTVERYTSMTPIENRKLPYAWGLNDSTCDHGLNDSDLTNMSPQDAQAAYNRVYGVRDSDLTLPDANGGQYVAAKYSGQSYYRFQNKAWDGKSLSGTISLPVIGLLPSSTYGNNSNALNDTFENLWAQGVRQTTPIDIRMMLAGLHVDMKDGSSIGFGNGLTSQVPDFTTTAEPAGIPEGDLTSDTKGNIEAGDGDNAGKVEAGKSARIYINDLKESCKADDASCFWYGYIYSDPTKLVSAQDGGPELLVQKDDAGKYYVDAFIPDGFSGEHKIALTDETGTLQGWTDVTVAEGTPGENVTVYRLYNPNDTGAGSHHYTASVKERDDLVAAGWRDEGTAFVTTATGEPVYRAYNPNDGSHFYTLDKQEFDDAVKAGWRDEGVAFHVSKDAKVPLYRLYNPNTGEHFYTTNADEAKGDVAAGWRDEGTAWNVIK